MKVPYVKVSQVIYGNKTDQLLRLVFKALNSESSGGAKETVRLEKLILILMMELRRLFYHRKLCVLHTPILATLEIAHDSRLGGNFQFDKKMSNTG